MLRESTQAAHRTSRGTRGTEGPRLEARIAGVERELRRVNADRYRFRVREAQLRRELAGLQQENQRLERMLRGPFTRQEAREMGFAAHELTAGTSRGHRVPNLRPDP